MRNNYVVVLVLFLAANMGLRAQDEGEPALDFKVETLEGDTFRLADQEGKVVLVFFFSNDCGSCVVSGGKVEQEIYQVYKDSEYFVAIGIDTQNNSSNENTVSGFKSSTGITFPLGLKGGDIAASYKTSYDFLGVIDSEGILVHKGILIAGNDIGNAVAAIDLSLITLGINDIRQTETPVVYPNPASEVLYIRSGVQILTELSLFDMTGKKVLQTTQQEISLTHLNPGLYFYSIPMGGELISGKLLIR